MGAARALELRAVTVDGLVEVVPYVDGRSLVDVVGRFESARGYSPAGAYGGLVPAFFRYCLLDTSPRPRARRSSRMPASA